jgi:TonB family protein
MKKSVIFLGGMLITMIAAGQNQRTMEEITVTPPKFSGAEIFIQGNYFATVEDYLYNAVQYPQEALTNGMQGTEVVRFVVTPAGNVSGFTIINSICPEIDKEVIRVLSLSNGLWKPGSINGTPAAMEQEVSVAFKLHPTNDFVTMAKDYLKQGNRNLQKGNLKRALGYFNEAVNLLPREEALLAVRGMCRCQCGDKAGAVADCERLKSMGYFDKRNAENEFTTGNMEGLKAFAETVTIYDK